MNQPQMQIKTKVDFVTATLDDAGQRIDNFLLARFKGMPKSHIYRLLRKGELRINKKRVSAFYRIQVGDLIRLPPVYLPEKASAVPPSKITAAWLIKRILYEDENLIILNKPSGMSVHLGSTVRIGVIEALRHIYPKLPQLELAHRLDAETSGCLILAKKKRILREIHGLLREGQVSKIYWALTKGVWKKSDYRVDLPLHKDYHDGGKHVVCVHAEGKTALSVFHPLQEFVPHASLMKVILHTGRTHQIRVHAQAVGHPIAGDDRYGDTEFNKWARQFEVRRLFLHARSVEFTLPSLQQRIRVEAPMDDDLEIAIEKLSKILK